MRRSIVSLTAVALMIAMIALTAMPAFAGVIDAEVGETSVSALDLVNVKLGGIKVGVL